MNADLGHPEAGRIIAMADLEQLRRLDPVEAERYVEIHGTPEQVADVSDAVSSLAAKQRADEERAAMLARIRELT